MVFRDLRTTAPEGQHWQLLNEGGDEIIFGEGLFLDDYDDAEVVTLRGTRTQEHPHINTIGVMLRAYQGKRVAV